MSVLGHLLQKRGRTPPGATAAGLLLLLLAGPASAQELAVNFPAPGDILITGQSTSLSVTVPTSQVLTYQEATLEVRITFVIAADEEERETFRQSGMTVEFPSAFTADGGVEVRDQDGGTRTVFGDAATGEIRLGSRDNPVIGTVTPTPDEDSTFSLTVTFSAEPGEGVTRIAVPTAADVSAVIAAMQIAVPADTDFTGDFLLRVRLTPEQGEDESTTAILRVEPPLPMIEIARTLVVAAAAGAMSRISPGEVDCAGRRCRAPRPYFAAASCGVSLRQALPRTCASADTDGDGRLELPALYSDVVWVVADDSGAVLARAEQMFYVAPVIGFDTLNKIRPAGSTASLSVGLSVSAVPDGAFLGSVTVQVRRADTGAGVGVGAAVTFNDEMMSTRVAVVAPAAGTLELAFVASTQRSTPANYVRLTPEAPDDADNYLYAVGNGEVGIADLQDGLLSFESETMPPRVVTMSFTISDFVVREGTVRRVITDDNVEAGILGDPDASSVTAARVSGDGDMNDLMVTLGTPSDGDIIELTLVLPPAEGSSATRSASLLFSFFTESIADEDANNVPDDGQVRDGGALQVYDEQGVLSLPIRVSGGLPVLGAYALNVAENLEPPPAYSAAFSPEGVAAGVLPAPPAYNRAGVFDFSVTGLDNPGDVATVLIPLLGEVRAGAQLSKYGAAAAGVFGWRPFTTGAESAAGGFFDRIWSAPKTADLCPAFGAARGDGEDNAWRPAESGLRAGDECLLLQIQDGGPNDADGLVNGVIYDPNAVTGGRSGGGGGAMDWAWLLALSMGLLTAGRGRGLRPR